MISIVKKFFTGVTIYQCCYFNFQIVSSDTFFLKKCYHPL